MKKNILILFLFLISVICVACQRSEIEQPTLESSAGNSAVTDSVETNSADGDAGAIFIKPAPSHGEVVATIQGEDYRYDPAYLFQLTMDSKWDDFQSEYVMEAVWQELIAIEGEIHSSGLAVPEAELEKQVEQRRLKYFDDAVEANQSNIDRMNKILVENNISSEDFWERQKEYVLKDQYISMEASRIWSGNQSQNENDYADAYFENYMEQLMEKYNVQIIQ